ncbi:MAG TPA: radical SAM protein [Candidatus Omnitrophota bacterium]|nr:radical SAM protein [Candidatus Omnitrophota bacterium]
MNILLIRPPLGIADRNAITKREIFLPPVGISYIASFLKQHGFQSVKIVDFCAESLAYIERYFTGVNADLIGISCLTGQHLESFRIAQLAKTRIQTNPLVVLGGPHVSAEGLDIQIMENTPHIDFIVRGEGEVTMLELVKALATKSSYERIEGLTFRKDSNGSQQVFRNPDRQPISNLDIVPFPDYSRDDFSGKNNAFDGHHYIKPQSGQTQGFRYAPLISSRGCPYDCQFCSRFWGTNVRMRSPENIFAEMMFFYENLKISHFTFLDDCFNVSIPRIKTLCRYIIEKKLPFTWTAVGRANFITEDLLQDMKRAGCVGIDFGVESGDPGILNTINKKISVDTIEKAFALTRKYGLRSKALLMVGNPGETRKSIANTIALMKRTLPDTIDVAPIKIFPNSHLHKLALTQGAISQDYWLKNPTAPYYTVEYTADRLRYFRLKVLLGYHKAKKNFPMVLKLLILISGVRCVIASGRSIDSIRDSLLKIPLIGSLLKKLKTV